MVDVNKLLKRRDNRQVFKDINDASQPALDVNRLCRRRSNAKSDLDKWRSLLETAYHYSMPDYNPFENFGQGGAVAPGQQYSADTYDLTLVIAHKRLADKMLMGLVPQGQQWMKFKPGDAFGSPTEDLYMQAAEATQEMTDQFYKILDRSNFYTAVGESLNDVLISTGALAINEGTRKDPLKFEAVPASHIMFEGNAQGGIDAVFRDWYNVRVENIKEMWPGADAPKDKDADHKVTIWECAYRDNDATDDKKYKYVVMTDSKEILLEQSNPSWPWVVYRMRKLAGETRGRGPSMQAYPTAATINEAMKDELIAAAFKANPMYMAASDSAFNQRTFTAKPGAVVPVQMVMGQWPIQGFPATGDINFSALVINDLRQQINELMFSSPLGNIANTPDRTATEVSIRNAENLEAFAAMVPRLQSEFFTPVIERSMWIINKVLPDTFGRIDPEIKSKMLSLDGELLDLRYETPLMTERGKIKITTLMDFYQSVSSMIGPEGATAVLDVPNVVINAAEDMGIDLKNIKSKDELDQLMAAAGQAADQVAEQQGVDINEQ